MSEKNEIEKILDFGVIYSQIYFTCRLIQNKQSEQFAEFAQETENSIECMFDEVEKMARRDRFDLARFEVLYEKIKKHQDQCNKHIVKMQSFGDCIFH